MGKISQAPLVGYGVLLLLSVGLAQMASTTDHAGPGNPTGNPPTGSPPPPSNTTDSPPPASNTTDNPPPASNTTDSTYGSTTVWSYDPWVASNCPAIAAVAPSCDRPKDCAEVQALGYNKNGVYTIYLGMNNEPVKVFCEMENHGGGWTVFQRRYGGVVDFFRGWDEYRDGFGNLYGEFWLGNHYLHMITQQKESLLHVGVMDFAGNMSFAEYEYFRVGPSFSSYRLNVGAYSGNAGNSMNRNDGMKFSTKDRENDIHATIHCANQFQGAWWFRDCGDSDLNGVAYWGTPQTYRHGIRWKSLGDNYSQQGTIMMVKPMWH